LPSLSLGAQADTWPEDGHPSKILGREYDSRF
jgi:hypothetical protein